jgi:hypothetical protein
MKLRGGDFSTGTMGNFQSELTHGRDAEQSHCLLKPKSQYVTVSVAS